MNKYKKILSLFLVMMTILSVPVLADNFKSEEILILGNDLTPQMIQDLKGVYGITEPIEELIITNQEEHEALGEYISAEVITDKSMSSAYVKLLEPGSGIRVKTHNINWVTEDMYRNALSTAGIKDAEVMVAGPFPVSGTAALTGSMKAYEELTGIEISEENKDAANDEMITTVELGDEIGKDKAEKIITEVKIFIAENDVKDPEVIKEAIEDAADNINITLTEEQMEQISNLMEKISKIEIDVDQMKSQLGDMIDKIDQIDINTEEVKGILFRMIDAVKGFFDRIFD